MPRYKEVIKEFYEQIGEYEFNRLNPYAQAKYAAKGVDEQEPFFMKDLKDVISKVWNKI